MRLLIIAGGGMLLTPEHIKERKKRRQWVHPWIRKIDSKGANYFIINDLRLTDKEDFRKYRFLKQNNLFHKIMFPLFLYKWTLFIKMFLTTHACFCCYVMEFTKQKNMFCISEASL